jgi:hypothetical protein
VIAARKADGQMRKIRLLMGSGLALAFLFAGSGTAFQHATPRAPLAARVSPAGAVPCCQDVVHGTS